MLVPLLAVHRVLVHFGLSHGRTVAKIGAELGCGWLTIRTLFCSRALDERRGVSKFGLTNFRHHVSDATPTQADQTGRSYAQSTMKSEEALMRLTV